MTQQTSYLRLYPNIWPIISVKNYRKDLEGWWNPIMKRKKKSN